MALRICSPRAAPILAARAQNYPNLPIRLIVLPPAAGDTSARIIAQPLSDAWARASSSNRPAPAGRLAPDRRQGQAPTALLLSWSSGPNAINIIYRLPSSRAEGLRFHRLRHRGAEHPRGARRLAREQRAGAARAHQGESRQGELRLGRRRLFAAPGRLDADRRHRYQHRARALQRYRPRGNRPHRGAHR